MKHTRVKSKHHGNGNEAVGMIHIIWWGSDVQIAEFVKNWTHAQTDSEADVSKYGQIRRPYPAPIKI